MMTPHAVANRAFAVAYCTEMAHRKALKVELGIAHGEALRFDARNLKGIRRMVLGMKAEATSVLCAIKAFFAKAVALFA